MGTIRIVGKRGRGRCAYCRDDLPQAEQELCGGCGTSLHAACRQELGGCPTFGCAQASPSTQQTREEARAARREGREGRLRVRERGRVTRDPPGLLARFGPYSRMALRTVWHLAILALLAVTIVYVVAHPKLIGKFFTEFVLEGHLIVSAIGLGFVVALVYFAHDWLRRAPGFWVRVGELLDDGEVTSAEFSTFTTGSGKSTTTHVRLTAPNGQTREIRAEGFLKPFWLSWRAGQTVYVHGEDDDEPCLIEFEDGTLALLDPS